MSWETISLFPRLFLSTYFALYLPASVSVSINEQQNNESFQREYITRTDQQVQINRLTETGERIRSPQFFSALIWNH